MFINTTVTTIYPVTQEQKQGFILDSSLATVSNLSASSLTPVSPSYVGAPALIFTLYLEQSSLGMGIYLYLELCHLLKGLTKTVSMTGKGRN